MSTRVRRCPAGQPVEAFDWDGTGAQGSGGWDSTELSAATMIGDSSQPSHPVTPFASAQPPNAAEIERDAFNEGYAQGERAGNEAAAARGEAMRRRLSSTIEEIASLRPDMIQQTERQLVKLAIAIARRITLRELTLDRTLLSSMARAALDRLGETAAATIRLHPDDHRAIAQSGTPHATTGSIRVVADPSVAPGGCIVQSDHGLIDAGLDAQLAEISGALDGGAAKPDEVIFVAA